jgi:branched-subunit amino acid ABC-type transport system permease component
MDALLHQVFSGLATGCIYGSIGLALVMIYQATHHINFAQGEIATFSTFIAWALLQKGWPYWVAFVATVAISFAGGLAIQRLIVRPVERAPVLTNVIVFIGLLVIFNSLSGGEQQMLAVSRALMLRPKLLLLDEPSFGLAPLIVRELFDILAEINKAEGTSVLLVEQNASLALRLADHAYLLETGNVVISGTAESIRNDESVRRSYLGF